MKPRYGNEPRRFYLVQRIYESPRKRYEGYGMDANPFGYGRLGDYELDYMGSAEFEFGAIPDSLNRFAAAHEKNDIMRGELTYNDHKLVFCFIGSDGDPTEDFLKWVKGEGFSAPFYGKEIPYTFYKKLLDPVAYAAWLATLDIRYNRETVVWWSLDDDVMWSFIDEDGTSHLEKMLESMGETAPNKVRGY